jgi:hypothetical protein
MLEFLSPAKYSYNKKEGFAQIKISFDGCPVPC